MKVVYTPKVGKFSKSKFDRNKYESQAEREIVLKRRIQITEFKKEIERRTAENYHLDE